MPSSGRERTRFVVDAMLGSLARKLRVLGFDAAYFRSGDDAELIGISLRESRTILSSDRALAVRAKARGASVVLVEGTTDGRRLAVMVRKARAQGLSLVRGEPLCSLCGGELKPLGRRHVAGLVPPSVERSHRKFNGCASCGRIYWRGSHWKKLRSLAGRLREKQLAPEP